jgi:hypothetical protein
MVDRKRVLIMPMLALGNAAHQFRYRTTCGFLFSALVARSYRKRPFLRRPASRITRRVFSPLLPLKTLLEIYFSYLGQYTAFEKQAYIPIMLVG